MAEEKYVPRLKELYYSTVRDQMQQQFGYKNVMMIPKIEKIVVNMGVGEAAQDAKAIAGAVAGTVTLDELYFVPSISVCSSSRVMAMQPSG